MKLKTIWKKITKHIDIWKIFIYSNDIWKEGIKLQKYTLKELRARKNMTQSEVAESIGIAVQTYNAWEKDVSGVAIGKVQALANLFGVTIGEIFLP